MDDLGVFVNYLCWQCVVIYFVGLVMNVVLLILFVVFIFMVGIDLLNICDVFMEVGIVFEDLVGVEVGF